MTTHPVCPLKKYGVHASLFGPAQENHNALVSAIWADGRQVANVGQTSDQAITVRHVRVGPDTLRPLGFSAIRTTGQCCSLRLILIGACLISWHR